MPTISHGAAALPTMQTAEDVITRMRQNPANWGNIIFESVSRTDQFLKLLSKAKTFFNEGEGDEHKFTIMSVTRPSESDIGTWQRVGKARPGYNPSQQSYDGTIRYGHRQVTGSLFRHGVRTEWMNKLDLAMTPKRDAQLTQVTTIIGNYSKHLWELWSRRMFQKSIRNTVLNTTHGWAADRIGSYPEGIEPDSLLTFDWLKAILPAIRSATRGFESAAAADKYTMEGDKQLVFIGYQEYAALLDQYQTVVATRYNQSPEEIHIPGLDLVGNPLGQFIFVLMPEPPRYREPGNDETWADCIVPPTIPNPTQGGPLEGDMDIPNPDYHNPAIAKYSESFIVNLDAIKWLVPPSAMTGTLNGAAGHTFPASNYMGEFYPVDFQCYENLRRENVMYIADFMSGMVGLFPQRARAILSLAAHQTVSAYTLSGTVPGAVALGYDYAIHSIGTAPGGNLLLLVGGTLPSIPVGHTLWLVSESGAKMELTDGIVASTATAATANTPAGTTIEVAELDDEATPLTLAGDPWARIIALPTE